MLFATSITAQSQAEADGNYLKRMQARNIRELPERVSLKELLSL